MRAINRNRSRSRGQSLLELAIVFPLMLLFFCGVLDIGFAMTRNIILVSAASQMTIAIEQDPTMLQDLPGCADYLEKYFPGNLRPDNVEVKATPKTGQQTLTYKYRIWGDDASNPNNGEFKERTTYFRYQDYVIDSTIECDFLTPVGKVAMWLFPKQDPMSGYDYKVTRSIQCRIDGALVGGSPW